MRLYNRSNLQKIILLAFFFIPSVMLAQVTEVWSARFNGASNTFDGANAMAIDKAGNVYVTGTANRVANSPDYCTIKYNAGGDTAWVRYYNGTGNSVDAARAIAVDNAGNVYVTGSSRSGSASGTDDYFTIKYNAAGDTMWTRRYNGPGNKGDQATAIGIDDSSNVYVTGGSDGGASAQDIFTIKYNTDGAMQWTQRQMGSTTFGFSDYGLAMAVTGSGDVHVAGYTDDVNQFWDFATIKYDRSGTFLWKGTYQGPVTNVSEQANAVAVDGSGNVYITGTSAANASVDLEDIVTVKYNSSGVQQWLNRYNASSYDIGNVITVGPLGGVYVGGSSNGSMTTIKYKSNGDTAWVRRYSGTGQSEVYAIAVDGSDNVYVAGRSAGASGDYDFVTIKYNPAGDTVWTKKYNGPAKSGDEAHAVQVDASGNVYVSGNSTGIGTNGDFYTVKYSQSTSGVESRSNEIPSNFHLFQNYPNPFNPTTTITFSLSPNPSPTGRGEGVRVTLKVYDVLGREVATLLNEKRREGVHSVQFSTKGGSASGGDAAELSTGVYIYTLRAGGFVASKKLLLMK
jgi:uncharacterized delta-60 repeat protein